MLPGEAVCTEGEVVLNALLGEDRRSGGHVAQNGDLVTAGSLLLRHSDGAGLAFRLDDHTGLLQALEMEVDGGGGFQPHCRPDLPDRGGIAVAGGEKDDVVIDLLLFGGQFCHDVLLSQVEGFFCGFILP